MRGSPDNVGRRHRSITLRAAAVLVGLLGLGSCVGADNAARSEHFDRAVAAQMFSAGYEGIAEYYVDAVPTDVIALGALAGVAKLDPALTYESRDRSEEHTSELQSLMRISYAVFCLKKTKK